MLDKEARVPVRLISHKSSGINHFRYGTDSESCHLLKIGRCCRDAGGTGRSRFGWCGLSGSGGLAKNRFRDDGQAKHDAAARYAWKRLRPSKARIEAVAMDMSAAYREAVSGHLPRATIVFDMKRPAARASAPPDEPYVAPKTRTTRRSQIAAPANR
jgi:hypothetical protein